MFYALSAKRDLPRAASLPGFNCGGLIPSFSALAAVVVAVFTLQTLHNHRPTRTGNEIASAEMADTEATDFDVLSGDDDSDETPLL